MKAVFLDRDGTINFGVPKYDRVDSVGKVELLPGVIEALTLLAQLNYQVFLVTNQAGLAEGIISRADFEAINARVLELIAPSGIKIVKTYVCPHGEGATCECRKPKPGMLLQAAQEFDIDLSQSWMIGDRETDILTGQNAGAKTILVQTGAITESPGATYVAADLLAAVTYITEQA